jgi:RNA polymerase sigma-70 factor (ECF subfamily)
MRRAALRLKTGNNGLVSGNYPGYDIPMTSDSRSTEAPRLFPHTRWSAVLAVRERSAESAAALEAICRAYWPPLYTYIRRCGHSPHDAEDLTQEFFRQLIEKHWLEAADREKGRLRTFLIVTLKNFMSKEWRRASAQKRGGGLAPAPFDTAFAESRLGADAAALAPDEAFDRQWALTLLDLTINRLRGEFAASGNPEGFEALKSCLMAGRGTVDYAAVARQLGGSEGAARVAAHRLRKRFREIYREEILHTLAEGTDVDAEMRHLAAALARE